MLHPLILGSPAFQARVRGALPGPGLRTSHFVRMEFRRSRVARLAEFCLQLDLPGVDTADQLVVDWGNRFGRESRFVLDVLRNLTPSDIDLRNPAHKEAVFRILSGIVRQWEFDLTETAPAMHDAGPRCDRARQALPALSRGGRPADPREALVRFVDGFSDEARCRSRCAIEPFLEQHRPTIEGWIESSAGVRGLPGRAMRSMARKARRCLQHGLHRWTCRDCGRLGDWVIALDCPRDHQLEHVDHVFDHLCPSLGLRHRKHAPDRIPGAGR